MVDPISTSTASAGVLARIWKVIRGARKTVEDAAVINQRLTSIEEELRELRIVLTPYRDTFEYFDLCWAWNPVEQRNSPYCPACRSHGRLVPMTVVWWDANNIKRPYWSIGCPSCNAQRNLSQEEMEKARGYRPPSHSE